MGAVCATEWKLKTRELTGFVVLQSLKSFLSLYVCTHRKTHCTNERQLYVPNPIYCLLPGSLNYGFVWSIVGVKREGLEGFLT